MGHALLKLFAVAWPLLLFRPAAAQVPAPLGDAETRTRLDEYMAERASAGFSGVVIVARDGKVLLQRGYGYLDAGKTRPVAADSVFTTGSITKQFTAAAILKLEMQGRLKTNEAMARYLPGVPDDKRAITIHQLLTHTAGFPPASGDDLEAIGRDAFERLVLSRPLAQAPGTYEYSNVGYSLLAAILERVSGRTYEAFVSDQLFVPAGMSETGYSRPKWATTRLAHAINSDGTDRGTFGEVAMPNGTPGWHLLGNGGILSTVGDMYRWHLALEGDAVLSPAAKDKLFRAWVDEGGGSSYGYGWSIEETPFGKLVTHNGGNQFFFSDFFRYLDRDVVVYFSTNSRERAMRRIGRPMAQIALAGRVLDRPEPTFMPVATASAPAPPGTLAAKWQLPAGSAAEAAARLLNGIAEPDADRRRALVPEVFAASLIERRSAAAMVEFLGRMRDDFGGLAVAGYEEARDASGAVTAVRLRFAPAGQPPLLVTFTLEPAALPTITTRVVGVELQMGQ